jgi:hypothetical protein
LAGWLGSHAVADIEQRYTLYVTFEVVLAVHVKETFEVPAPDRVSVTLLSALVKEMLPEAGPGDPEAGANMTLNVWL